MTLEWVLASACAFCLVSWFLAFQANREFRHLDRLPGLWTLKGEVARLDNRVMAVFLYPCLLLIVAGFVCGISFFAGQTSMLGLVGPCTALLVSQFLGYRATRKWIRAQA